MKPEVFISYSWDSPGKKPATNSPVAEQIAISIGKEFKVVFDRKDVNYKADIRKFEERLAKGSRIILVVSDKFLRSRHCMYEFLKIRENGKVNDRVFPIVMKDAKIYHAGGAVKYIKHWEQEIGKLNAEIKQLRSKKHIRSIKEELDLYKQFREIMDEIIDLLKNMNTLSPDIHQENNFGELSEMLKAPSGVSLPAEQSFLSKLSKTDQFYQQAIQLVAEEMTRTEAKDSDILSRLQHWHEQCKSQTFRIAVMAMVKSGKSTFLNALLADEFLPMSNVPETAVPVRIVHSPHRTGKLSCGKGREQVGSGRIRQHLQEKNDQHRKEGSESPPEYVLHACLSVLDDKSMSNVQFEILDTPGFGEALKEVVAGKTIDQSNDDLVDQISVIIYLLDYTKLKTKNEEEVIHKLTSIRADMLEKIQERLFFVVNKIDSEDRNSLSQDKTVDYVFTLISSSIPQLKKEQIFLVSANNALLARLMLEGKASGKAKKDFGEKAFGLMAKDMSEQQYLSAAQRLLDTSNITGIEDRLINFIYDKRGQIFLETSLAALRRLLTEFCNKYIITAQGTLKITIDAIEELEKQINETKKKQYEIQDEASRFDMEMKTWINNEFKHFEKTIQDQVESVFDPEKAQKKESWRNSFIPGWVKDLHERFYNIFSGANTRSKENMEERVQQLNHEISTQLNNQFILFRSVLERKIDDKQRDLLTRLENSINVMAREFEKALGKGLNVNFITTPISLNHALNFSDVLSDANNKIDRFINRRQRTVHIQTPKQVYRQSSWCSSRRLETVYESIPTTVNRYDVSKTDIELFWKSSIESMNKNAITIANHFIEQQIQEQVKKARQTFDNYVDEYLFTIQSEKARLSSQDIGDVKTRLESLDLLKEKLENILRVAEDIAN